jgi:hypothetical protein
MADNVVVTPGTGNTVAADEVTDATLGSCKVQYVKLMDGTLDGTTKGVIGANGLAVDVKAAVITSGTITAVTGITNPVAVTNAGITSIDGKITACNTGAVVLAAGTAGIGKLTANSGVDIGDVDVASCALPTGAATSAKQLANNHDVVVTSMPALGAGTNLLGKVGIDQATANANEVVVKSGTVTAVTSITNAVAVTNAGITSIDGKITACNTGAVVLAAGTAEFGKLAEGVAEIGNVKNSGTFAVQAACTLGAETTKVIGTVNVSASQSIGVTQATAGNLNMTEASASAIKTAVEVIDNCISGSEAQVDVVAALPAGTNNIGDVDVLSFASGKTIKRAVISGATSGDNTIVAAVVDKKIKVLSVFLVAITAVTVRFESGAAGTALTGVMSIGATGGFVLPPPSDPTNHWFETGVNTLLNMELGGAVQVSGAITYYEEA